MAAVFLSYKRENLARAQPLVKALRANSVEVWWDQDIATDAPWEATIERELNAAKVVIAAWSQAAIASENVKAEARSARNAGKLIQVFVEKCEPPLFFGERQGVDLSTWNGDANDHRFQSVLAAVRAVLEGKRPPEGVGYAPKKRAPWATLTAIFVAASAILGFVSNLGGARDAVCKLGALETACVRFGLVATTAEDTHEALLRSVIGVWGNPARGGDPACTTTMHYALSHRGGEDYITLTMPGYESVGRVASAEGGSIFTRTVTPQAQAGTQWELRIEADRLIQVDNVNTPTPLVRCGD